MGLLVELPWILVALATLIAWLGPERLRPTLRKACKQSFLAYIGLSSALHFAILALRAVMGSTAEHITNLYGLFLASVVFSGALISVFMPISLASLSASTALHWRAKERARK